ncbi:hypothetical protein ZHAS_00022240 [Anopheles sinensis]|uniref:Uncharacterized protein n=1 Tax=Anopheles sinensis TaxID=74873 RepID=A0A084WUU4_ANOSI|nr:hypothetical protein ZHAS_00022240 [Anopheles sinensis]
MLHVCPPGEKRFLSQGTPPGDTLHHRKRKSRERELAGPPFRRGYSSNKMDERTRLINIHCATGFGGYWVQSKRIYWRSGHSAIYSDPSSQVQFATGDQAPPL